MSTRSRPSEDVKKLRRLSKRKHSNKIDDNLEDTLSSVTVGTSYFSIDLPKTKSLELDSEPDRSEPAWKVVSDEEVCEEPSQKVDFEGVSKPTISIWEEIMIEYEEKRLEYNNLLEISKPYEPNVPICSKLSAVQYLEKHIFPLLCPILQETLVKAEEAECLMIQKCRFNGLDYISELLWNRNPLHPCRHKKYNNIFNIPFVIIWLYHNPRPIYPLSWLWSKEEAIIMLQTYIRRYFVCKEPECSEMRQFWKIIKTEKEEQREAIRLQKIEQIEKEISCVLDLLVANAVFEAEKDNKYCRCFKKPCTCVCKCKKLCKCCTCDKSTVHSVGACTCQKL